MSRLSIEKAATLFLKVGFWTLFDALALVLGFCLLGLLNLGLGFSST